MWGGKGEKTHRRNLCFRFLLVIFFASFLFPAFLLFLGFLIFLRPCHCSVLGWGEKRRGKVPWGFSLELVWGFLWSFFGVYLLGYLWGLGVPLGSCGFPAGLPSFICICNLLYIHKSRPSPIFPLGLSGLNAAVVLSDPFMWLGGRGGSEVSWGLFGVLGFHWGFTGGLWGFFGVLEVPVVSCLSPSLWVTTIICPAPPFLSFFFFFFHFRLPFLFFIPGISVFSKIRLTTIITSEEAQIVQFCAWTYNLASMVACMVSVW